MTWTHLQDKTMDKNIISFDVQLLEQIERKDNDRVKLTLNIAKDLCNAVDASGNSLLHYAAKFGNETITSYLIELGAKVKVENENGDTPLLLATKGSNAESVKTLLKSNADIYFCNKNGESAVQIALQTSPIDVEIAKLFLKRVSDDRPSDSTEIAKKLMKIVCPLYVAVLLENVDVTTCMISEGCKIAAKDATSGKTALHFAVENADSEHVKKLLFLGADDEARDASGKVPLAMLDDFSKSKEATDIFEMLTRDKDNLTSCDNDGFMQMRSVVQNGTKDVIRKVLHSSCVLTVEDQNQQNIIHYLAENCNSGIVDLLFSSENLRDYEYKNFTMGRFDLNARDKFGLTALHYAMNVGNASFVKLLFKKNVDFHILSDDGVSPFLQAVRSTIQSRLEQRVTCVMLLLTRNCQSDIFMKRYFKDHDSESAIERDYPFLEPAVAILAARKATDAYCDEVVSKKIHSYPRLKRHFDACTIELQRMKNKKACWSMSVLDVLTDHVYTHYPMSFAISGLWAKRVIRRHRSIPFYHACLSGRICNVMRSKRAEIYDRAKTLSFLFVVTLIVIFIGCFIGHLARETKIFGFATLFCK